MDATLSARLRSTYKDLHAHPELSGLPSNHSPHFRPAPEPTITISTGALTAAARHWLD